MKNIIEQIKQKRPKLGIFSLILILGLVFVVWIVGKIYPQNEFFAGIKSASAQSCWTPPPAPGCGGCAMCATSCDGGSSCGGSSCG